LFCSPRQIFDPHCLLAKAFGVAAGDEVDRGRRHAARQSLALPLRLGVNLRAFGSKPGRRGFINITPKIEELVSQSGVREGLCLVNAMHITASVFINDDESGLHDGINRIEWDFRRWNPVNPV
jgi:hypothetical protein